MDHVRIRPNDTNVDIFSSGRAAFFSPHADCPAVSPEAGKVFAHILDVEDGIVLLVFRKLLVFFCRHFHDDVAQITPEHCLVILVHIESSHGRCRLQLARSAWQHEYGYLLELLVSHLNRGCHRTFQLNVVVRIFVREKLDLD